MESSSVRGAMFMKYVLNSINDKFAHHKQYSLIFSNNYLSVHVKVIPSCLLLELTEITVLTTNIYKFRSQQFKLLFRVLNSFAVLYVSLSK